MHWSWLAIGFLPKSFSIKVKVLGGGFILRLGDNIVILSMVKRSHPLLSNNRNHTPISGDLSQVESISMCPGECLMQL
jgi:hypothetical protein